MISQRIERSSLVQELRDAAATCQFVGLSIELSQLVPGEIAQTGSGGLR
jgi:hypothetical protein